MRFALGGLSLVAVLLACRGASAQVDSQGNWYPPYDVPKEPPPVKPLPIGQCPILSLDPPAPECAPYYRVRRSVRLGPIVWGTTLFTISHVIAVAVAIDNGFANGSGYLVIPLVGPFVAATKVNGCGFGRPAPNADCNTDFPAVGLLFDGVMQIFGAALAPLGVAWQRPFSWLRLDAGTASVTPVVTSHGVGLAGTF